MSASVGAWERKENNTYGFDRFPFGKCEESPCQRPACYRIPAEDSKTGYRFLCRGHKPDHIIFAPFLGQQEKLFMATERWVLGGGGAGPGKTYAGARLFLKQFDVEHRRWLEAKKQGKKFQSRGWALFCRRTMPELRQVIADWRKSFDSGKALDPGAKWDDDAKTCTFSSGYTIQFAGMENEADYLKYYGGEYTLIVLDEAVQFTKKQIMEIDSRLRSPDPVLSSMLQLYMLTNPVGPNEKAAETKAWLKKRFVSRGAEEAIKVKVKLADGRIITEHQIYIPCNLYDNPALLEDGKYEANLRLKSSHMIRALLFNDWDVDEGAWVGDDWNPEIHVCDPFPLGSWWPKGKGGDYGHGSLTSVQWFAITPEGGHICYRAFNCTGLTAKEVARRIKEIEREPLTWYNPKTGKRITITGPEWDEANDCSTVQGPMDASCWSKQGESENGESRGEQFENAGVGFYRSAKGTKLRHDAADHIRFRLRQRLPDANGRLDPGVPGLRYFRGTTETRMPDGEGGFNVIGPIHSIPNVPFDEKDPDIWNTKANDHDLDALAYFQLSRPPGGEQEGLAEVIEFMQVRGPAEPDEAERITW